ncbi:actin nucleation-promoting factor WAS-like, partial [Myiozetetes cayanensis]|uniref:actin nucleation-promoting factor WAS-like n=1 Tax=Myiozetetes cayanensis TaxID=478635 RepID=UPI00215F9585
MAALPPQLGGPHPDAAPEAPLGPSVSGGGRGGSCVLGTAAPSPAAPEPPPWGQAPPPPRSGPTTGTSCCCSGASAPEPPPSPWPPPVSWALNPGTCCQPVSDQLLAINGAPTAGMSPAQALARIRGGGSRLRLLLRRPHGETPKIPGTLLTQIHGDAVGTPL